MTLRLFLASAASAAVLAACAGLAPPSAHPDLAGLSGRSFDIDDTFPANPDEPAHDWYLQSGDPALESLVETALAENRDLKVAAANVAAARAALRLREADRRPSAQATADARYEELSLDGAPAGDTPPDAEFFYGVGLTAAWELDFFDRVRRLSEAAAADAKAASWLRRDAQSLIVTEVVSAYTDLRSAETGLEIAARNLDLQRDTVRITEARMQEGVGSRIDLVRAQAQLLATEAIAPQFRARRTVALNRLATLTAQPVTAIEATVKEYNPPGPMRFTDEIRIGDVASLLRRRADVRTAEQEFIGAQARLGVAHADYFPRISLLGNLTVSANDASGFGGPGSIGFGIGPQLVWSGFDRPRTEAGVAAAEARAQAAMAQYEQRILVAIEETQASFSVYGQERVRMETLAKATERAREAAELARLRYEEGADEFLNVLDSESRLLNAESDLLASRRALALALIDIYRSLGAGWTES